MKKKVIYTIIAATLLLLLYITIFFLSDEDGDRSAAVSQKVTELLMNFLYFFTGKGPNTGTVGTVISSNEGLVRKIAHFSEYAGVGLLSYSIIMLWYSPIWRGRFFVLLQLLVSAVFDEYHQSFIPGRNASWKDVLIDLSGGVFGILIILFFIFIQKKYIKRKRHSP